MSTPFGPRLIGETEKTLNALLVRFLDGTGLTEPQWVVLRLADADGGSAGAEELVATVADRAHFTDAAALVDELTARGLLEDGRLTPAGHDVTDAVLARSATDTAPIWADLPADDVAAATRLLNEIVSRARAVLG